jgi:hypothetical protein
LLLVIDISLRVKLSIVEIGASLGRVPQLEAVDRVEQDADLGVQEADGREVGRDDSGAVPG